METLQAYKYIQLIQSAEIKFESLNWCVRYSITHSSVLEGKVYSQVEYHNEVFESLTTANIFMDELQQVKHSNPEYYFMSGYNFEGLYPCSMLNFNKDSEF